ncbi:hypothetical protein EUX98_g6544 [Antrodiella citrinella]|uniref:Uncharacterized protein n=1 Tax=Antrodiella citrinella TaxID=2447956 RepID=A0A4S4MQI1_9APHY|nr:hypothetical protein EUX98_g6544 [Antrodiella citrinella]
MLSGLLSSMKERFFTTSIPDTKLSPPTPQWTTVVLMNKQAPTYAVQRTPSVPDDIYDDDDNRSIDSSSDADSLFSEEMDVVEEQSDATSASAMVMSAKIEAAISAAKPVMVSPPAVPALTSERLREHQALQDFVRAIHNPVTPGAQRYMIFADGYMWARNWREMENMSFSLDKLADTVKRSPWPISMVRSCWKQEFMKLFTYFGGVETHCIILTSSILSPDIHADIIELANSLPLVHRQALFSRLKFRLIQVLDDPQDPVPFNSEYLRDGFRKSLEDHELHDISVTADIVYASECSFHPMKISLQIIHALIPPTSPTITMPRSPVFF